MQAVIIRGNIFYKPLREHSSVTKLLNWSKLVECWLLRNTDKKLKLRIQHNIITMNLDIVSTGLHNRTASDSSVHPDHNIEKGHKDIVELFA